MSDQHAEWRADGILNGWTMPPASLWKRLPIIRHVRAIMATMAVDEHEAFWLSLGRIPTGYDRWVIYGIWHNLYDRAALAADGEA